MSISQDNKMLTFIETLMKTCKEIDNNQIAIFDI